MYITLTWIWFINLPVVDASISSNSTFSFLDIHLKENRYMYYYNNSYRWQYITGLKTIHVHFLLLCLLSLWRYTSLHEVLIFIWKPVFYSLNFKWQCHGFHLTLWVRVLVSKIFKRPQIDPSPIFAEGPNFLKIRYVSVEHK